MTTQPKSGTIKIILGPMFSGKTTELIKEYHKWLSIGKIPICINYDRDNRYGDISENNMYNHNLANVKCIHAHCLKDVQQHIITSADIILINEGQFFDDLVEYCRTWCEQYGKNIVVCGLDGDFKRKAFGQIIDLIPLAEEVTKLGSFCAKCKDGTNGSFTHRISTETEQIVIGTDNYIALCRQCYIEANGVGIAADGVGIVADGVADGIAADDTTP